LRKKFFEVAKFEIESASPQRVNELVVLFQISIQHEKIGRFPLLEEFGFIEKSPVESQTNFFKRQNYVQ
jgi:hypothetical protein